MGAALGPSKHPVNPAKDRFRSKDVVIDGPAVVEQVVQHLGAEAAWVRSVLRAPHRVHRHPGAQPGDPTERASDGLPTADRQGRALTSDGLGSCWVGFTMFGRSPCAGPSPCPKAWASWASWLSAGPRPLDRPDHPVTRGASVSSAEPLWDPDLSKGQAEKSGDLPFANEIRRAMLSVAGL